MKHFIFFRLGAICLLLTFSFSCGGGSGSGGGSGNGWAGVKGQFLNEDQSKLALSGVLIKLYAYDTDTLINQDVSDASGAYAIEDKGFEDKGILNSTEKKYFYITFSLPSGGGDMSKGTRDAYYTRGNYCVQNITVKHRQG